jgi:hypothetical protein
MTDVYLGILVTQSARPALVESQIAYLRKGRIDYLSSENVLHLSVKISCFFIGLKTGST